MATEKLATANLRYLRIAPRKVREMVIVGDHRSPITHAAEVLRRKKAEAPHRSQYARPAVLVLGADGLAGIFDDGHARMPGNS